jgi:hypothetical protein
VTWEAKGERYAAVAIKQQLPSSEVSEVALEDIVRESEPVAMKLVKP